MSERRAFVLQAPLGRALWSLAWPIALSNELSILSLGVLLFWLGRLAGETGLVVESLFRPLGLLVSWFFAFTSVGASTLVAQSVGARDGRGLSIAAGTVTFTLVLWAVLAVVSIPLWPLLADALVGDLPLEAPMLRFVIAWAVVALPALGVAEVLLDVANSTGATRFNLVRVLLDLALMAALTPVLMEVVGLGIAGGPVAEGLAAGGLVVVLWRALVHRRALLELGELGAGAWRIRRGLWKEIAVIGLPVQVGRIIMFGAQLVLVQLVLRDGAASVAGYGIAGALLLFGVMATLALAQGGAVLIGQALGAGLHERARAGVRTTLIAGWVVIAGFVGVTLFDAPIIGLFTSEPDVAAAASRALAILRWGAFGIATWQIMMACFAAHGATVRASILIVIGEGFGLAVALLWPGANLDAACIGFVAGNALKAALLLWLLASGALERARGAASAGDGGDEA